MEEVLGEIILNGIEFETLGINSLTITIISKEVSIRSENSHMQLSLLGFSC